MTYEELKEKVGYINYPWIKTDKDFLTVIKGRLGLEGAEAKQIIKEIKELRRLEKERERLKDLRDDIEDLIVSAQEEWGDKPKYEKAFKSKYEKIFAKFPSEIDDVKTADEAWNDLKIFWEAKEARKIKAEKARLAREAAKSKEPELKAALLKEYAEKYQLRCRFIKVSGPYISQQHRFVVEMPNNQVMCFEVPKTKFVRTYYDDAIKLCKIFEEFCLSSDKKLAPLEHKPSLGTPYQKRKVNQLLKSLNSGWMGLYDESKRKYLTDKYKDQV